MVIPVPYDSTSSYLPGTRRGPLSILEASTHMELFDEELKREVYPVGIHTMNQLEITAQGPEQMIEKVTAAARRCLKEGKFTVVVGGEHSVSLGMIRPLKEQYENLSVLQLDAHADLRSEYQGSRYSHACVGRRISEICPLCQVGIRSLSKEEWDYLASSKVSTLFAAEIQGRRDWMSRVLTSLSDEVYVTLDLDVFDPSIMPAVGTPEPGGMGWREILDLLKEVFRHKRVVGMDIVELTPIPGHVASDFLAAKLIYRMIGYWEEQVIANRTNV